MPQIPPTRLPRSRSTQSLHPPAAPAAAGTASASATPAGPSHRRNPSASSRPKPSTSGAAGTGSLRSKPSPLTTHRGSGSGTSTGSRSGIPNMRLRPGPGPRPPTSSSSSSLSTMAKDPAPPAPLRPVRSLTTLRPLTAAKTGEKGEKGKTPAPLTAARTGPAPSAKPFVPMRTRPRAATLVESPETPPRTAKAEKAEKLAPSHTGGAVKRTPSASRRSPVLGGTKRVAAPMVRGDSMQSTESLPQTQSQAPLSPPSKPVSTRSLIRRPLSLADRVFGGSSALRLAASKEANKAAPPSPAPAPPSPAPPSARGSLPRTRPPVERTQTNSSAEQAVRSTLRARKASNASPVTPKSPPLKPSPTAAQSSSTGPKFSSSPATSPRSPSPQRAEKPTPFKLPFGKRTPASVAQRSVASKTSVITPARSTSARSRSALPDTPALSTFLRDQSTRIGQIGEEDISLASSTSFRALTPPGHESSEAEFVSALAGQSSRGPLGHSARSTQHLHASRSRAHPHPLSRGASRARSPLSPASPLSPRRAARPIAAGTELRAELARLRNERIVLETRINALEAEEGRLSGLAEAAMRDRQRALESAEAAEVAREAAMWEVVVQAADEAIEEERALRVAIAAARALVMAM